MTAQKLDWMLITVTGILIIVGLMMMVSTGAVSGLLNFNDEFYYVKRQSAYLVIGLIAAWIGYRTPMQVFKKYAVLLYIVGVLLVGLTLVPGLGVKAGGATRWLNLGIVVIQPTEFVKFSISVMMAMLLANKGKSLNSFTKGVLPVLAVLALPVLIILKQPDLGSVLVILSVVFLALLLSPAKLWPLGALGVIGVCAIGINIWHHPYQMQRINSFLDPWADPLGKSYHTVQGLIAVGSGGLWGQGIGHGKLKYFYLPLHHSDFIFAVIGEEGGFWASMAVIILFAILGLRGVAISFRARTPFEFYFGIMCTLFLVIQAYLNIGVVIGVFPVTGIPLTFISQGGTSMVMSLISVSILLNIRKESVKAQLKQEAAALPKAMA